jgi:integrase
MPRNRKVGKSHLNQTLRDIDRRWTSDLRKLDTLLSKDQFPSNMIIPIIRKKARNLKDVTSHPNTVPYTTDQNTSQFLATAKFKLDFALRSGYAPQTNRNYSYAVERFKRFATQCGVPTHAILPASPHIVCLWIANGIGSTGPSTAKGNLSALAAWHKLNGAPFKLPAQISIIKKAISMHWPEDKRRQQPRKPISPAMIRALVHAWSSGSPSETCALAIALVAWCGQVRLGELLPPTQRDIDPLRVPRRKDWHASSAVPNASRIELPWTKTTHFKGEIVYLSLQHAPFDPTSALTRHFQTSPLPNTRLLFEYRQSSKIMVMDKETLMAMANRVWSSYGWPHITGHSFRIGGTTSYLRTGVSPLVVKKMGRWSSDAFLLYWRNNEELFAAHASNLSFVDFDI